MHYWNRSIPGGGNKTLKWMVKNSVGFFSISGNVDPLKLSSFYFRDCLEHEGP